VPQKLATGCDVGDRVPLVLRRGHRVVKAAACRCVDEPPLSSPARMVQPYETQVSSALEVSDLAGFEVDSVPFTARQDPRCVRTDGRALESLPSQMIGPAMQSINYLAGNGSRFARGI